MASSMMVRLQRLQEQRAKLATKFRMTKRTYSRARKRLQLEINLIDATIEEMGKFVKWQGKRKE